MTSRDTRGATLGESDIYHVLRSDQGGGGGDQGLVKKQVDCLSTQRSKKLGGRNNDSGK